MSRSNRDPHPGRRADDRFGGVIEIRQLDPGDVDVMARVFESLSPRERYLRFLTPVPRFTARMLRQLSDADGANRLVLVALRGERPIGEARLSRHRTDPDAADLALAVIDGEQRRGVARALLTALAEAADRLGIRRFSFDVSPENRRVLSFLNGRGVSLHIAEGLVRGALPVTALLEENDAAATAADGANTRRAA